MVMDDLNILLEQNNMAFSVLGSISGQTIAGAVSVGFHGTGLNYGNISSYVIEIEIMLASGEIRTFSRTSNSDQFPAVACSLGCLGVILSVKVQCEPLFRLEQVEYGAKLDDMLANLDVHLKSSDHFRMLWYPHTDYVSCYSAKRTDKVTVHHNLSILAYQKLYFYLISQSLSNLINLAGGVIVLLAITYWNFSTGSVFTLALSYHWSTIFTINSARNEK
jgi:FAD/FMN-containing dehydrogenase